jgi:hypothetical protein
MPVDLIKLKSLLVPRAKLAELTSTLDSMCESRELQSCNGIKGGKAYVCYWISGNLPPVWGRPSKVVANTDKPAPELKRKT